MPFATRTKRREREATESVTDTAVTREAALKLLERARRTRSDLERRLKDKGFAGVAVAEVLDRLAEVGLVDDAEYARAWLAGRWGRRPSGWRRLQQELRARGVGDEDVAKARAALAERGGAPDETGAAAKVVEQARRRFAALDPRVRRQRLYALLSRRGFDGDVIRRVLALPDASD